MSVIRRNLAQVLTLSLGLMIPAAGAALLSVPASAAAQDGDRIVVPLADGVQLRCGSGVAWYPVATLTAGKPLRALEESDGWVRVEYPAGTPIVVKSEEADLRGGMAVLTRRSRLRAFNPGSAVLEECYKAVFDQFLLPGVEMKYLGPIKTRDGAAGGLLVEAPAGASGFVLARELRPATPQEAQRFAATQAPAANDAVVAAPPSAAETALAAAPVESAPIETAPPADSVAAHPMEAQEISPAVESEVAASPAADAGVGSVGRALSLTELEAAFEKLMRSPLGESDPAELIEQYRAHQAANGQGSSAPGNSASGNDEYIASRIQALELRVQARELSDALNNLDQAVRQASESYRQSIDRLSKGREYQVVGRLLPSTVYDGKRLPLMFRLASIDSSSSRTLAYIAPDAGLDLDRKVGAIVGVLGESTHEPSAMVSVIRPVAVDVLQPSQASAPDDR